MKKDYVKQKNEISRRDFIKTSTQLGATAMLTGTRFGYTAGSDTIRVGLIGCGGRGTGAGIIDCAESSQGIELVAIGDLFQDHLKDAPEQIKNNLRRRNLPVDRIYKVTPETSFAGFDAYQKGIAGIMKIVRRGYPDYTALLQAFAFTGGG